MAADDSTEERLLQGAHYEIEAMPTEDEGALYIWTQRLVHVDVEGKRSVLAAVADKEHARMLLRAWAYYLSDMRAGARS